MHMSHKQHGSITASIITHTLCSYDVIDKHSACRSGRLLLEPSSGCWILFTVLERGGRMTGPVLIIMVVLVNS